MTIRVVQWTTGGVARAAVRAVLAQPELELVGCYVWSAGKAGKDVGELCNLPPLGVKAANDIEAILALKPDVVLYMPLVWNVDQMVRLLEGGINVISTANFITGHSYGERDRKRLDEAAKSGGVSLYGSGVNPGLASAVALTAAAACRQVERISIFEAADSTSYESAETWRSLGFGSPPDTPGLAETAKQRQLVFMDAVTMMAKALNVQLDEVRYTPKFRRGHQGSAPGVHGYPQRHRLRPQRTLARHRERQATHRNRLALAARQCHGAQLADH